MATLAFLDVFAVINVSRAVAQVFDTMTFDTFFGY